MLAHSPPQAARLPQLRLGPRAARRSLQQRLNDGNPSAIYNLQTIFDFADTDTDGVLTRAEVMELARALGYESGDGAWLDAICEQMACDAAGCTLDINFGDFASSVLELDTHGSGDKSDRARTVRIGRLFVFFDAQRHGHITIDDMTTRLSRLGFDIAGTEQLFVDVTGFPKSTISKAEFAHYIEEQALVGA